MGWSESDFSWKKKLRGSGMRGSLGYLGADFAAGGFFTGNCSDSDRSTWLDWARGGRLRPQGESQDLGFCWNFLGGSAARHPLQGLFGIYFHGIVRIWGGKSQLNVVEVQLSNVSSGSGHGKTGMGPEKLGWVWKNRDEAAQWGLASPSTEEFQGIPDCCSQNSGIGIRPSSDLILEFFSKLMDPGISG